MPSRFTHSSGMTKSQVLFSVLAAAIMCGFPIYFITRPPKPKGGDIEFASDRAPLAMQEAAAVGVPLTAKDLLPKPPVTDAENAAPLLNKAEGLLGTVQDAIKIGADLQAAQIKNDHTAVAKILAEHNDAMVVALKAAKMPRCYIYRDWDASADLTMPDLVALKYLVQLFVAHSEESAFRKDHKGALVDLEVAQKLSGFAGSDPGMIAMLLQLGLRKLVYRGVERCLEFAVTDLDALKGYDAFLNEPPPPVNIDYAMAGESYTLTSIIRNLDVNDIHSSAPTDPTKLVRSGLPSSPVSRAYLDRHWELWTRIYQDTTSANRAVAAARAYREIAHDPRKSYLLDAQFANTYDGIEDRLLDDIVYRKIVNLLAKALTYKAEKGAYAKDLSELDVQDADIFGAPAYHYTVTPKGIVIYSIGPDHKDDLGKPLYQDKDQKEHGDIVASYPPIPFTSEPEPKN